MITDIDAIIVGPDDENNVQQPVNSRIPRLLIVAVIGWGLVIGQGVWIYQEKNKPVEMACDIEYEYISLYKRRATCVIQ